MSYIGNNPVTQSFISGTDYFNGTGSQTAFTLSRTVASINDIQVTVNNVVQQPNDAYTISGTTLTMTSAPSSGTNNVYVRYLSTTTQAITPSQGTVSWNTLDSNVQGDLGISFKNRIINSNMAIDQRNAGASVTPLDGTYTLDRWAAGVSQTSKLTVQQNSTAPVGFVNSLLVTSSSAYSISSGDYFLLYQSIEGNNTADLGWGTANAKTVTLSFWVRSSLTGTFGGSLRNSGSTRSYPFSYTVSAANTFEQKTITITGDTSGTWLTTNGLGIRVSFGLGVGSDFSGTAGAWASANYASATGAVSVVGTNGATWYITGVQLEVGTQATTFTTAGGSYGAELLLCQRYYWKYINDYIVSGFNENSSGFLAAFTLPTQMRTAPTMGTDASATYRIRIPGATVTVTSLTGDSATVSSFRMNAATSGGLTAGQGSILIANANGKFIDFSAEL
jgi:hypothetical protein